MDDNRSVFTLSDLGKSLRSVIERNYSSTYWIKAEIAKLNHYPRSGHCYPELVHKTGNVIHAQMRATIWAADFKNINKQFTEITGEPLREGISILFRASVMYHPVYGLSLQIWEIEPGFTLGEMAVEKARVIQKLKEEGIFERNKTLPLPLLPKRIAIISVETSKGYHDFLNIIQANAKKYAVWHFLFPSILQGDKAVEGIISQLRIIRKVISRFDVVAIIRGGGGDIGLSCYDDYALSREIAMFPLPVISGIGHSTNETIAEMVSWANKITPTDVAYFILEQFKAYEGRIDYASTALTSQALRIIEKQKQYLFFLEENQRNTTIGLIQRNKEKLKDIVGTVAIQSSQICHIQRQIIDNLAFAITSRPSAKIISQKNILEKQTQLLSYVVQKKLALEQNKLENLGGKLTLLDPEYIMERGYSITTLNGMPLKDGNQLHEGDVINTRLKNGEIQSIVTAIQKSNKKSIIN
jgi:exodeoxyribonuclease VII large subunit